MEKKENWMKEKKKRVYRDCTRRKKEEKKKGEESKSIERNWKKKYRGIR